MRKLRSVILTMLASATLATAETMTLESAPPVVVNTIPVAGAKDVDPALKEIRVTFSKPMQDRSWSWSTWGKENLPEITGEPHYEAVHYGAFVVSDYRTCMLPVNLQPGRFYALWLNSDKFKNFKDTNGHPAVPYLLTFFTSRTPSTADTSGQLNDDQRAVLDWTDRQFRSYFDARTFAGISKEERAELETRLLDQLKGPHDREYYTAINSLAALHSQKALEPLRTIALDHADKDNRDRWMAIRALGILGEKHSVPELIHLVYHGNMNTRWWAQISLVRLTGQNFGKDWKAWGDWWNQQNGQPPFKPEIIRWSNSQPEPDNLSASLEQNDSKFLNGIKLQATAPKEQSDKMQTGEQYLQQQLKLAKAGDYWAKFNLWEAFSRGKHEVAKNATEADKWLSELVKGAYLARFEPVNRFSPKTPKEMLDKFNEYSQLRSGRDSLGGASFFRTTQQDNKLIGSFLTASPEEFKTALQKNPSLKLISIEKLTREMFLAHEAAEQESLHDGK